MYDTVGVYIECYFNLRCSAACRENTVKMEEAYLLVVLCELTLTLKNVYFNGCLVIGCR